MLELCPYWRIEERTVLMECVFNSCLVVGRSVVLEELRELITVPYERRTLATRPPGLSRDNRFHYATSCLEDIADEIWLQLVVF